MKVSIKRMYNYKLHVEKKTVVGEGDEAESVSVASTLKQEESVLDEAVDREAINSSAVKKAKNVMMTVVETNATYSCAVQEAMEIMMDVENHEEAIYFGRGTRRTWRKRSTTAAMDLARDS